jgi:hypothetical protein
MPGIRKSITPSVCLMLFPGDVFNAGSCFGVLKIFSKSLSTGVRITAPSYEYCTWVCIPFLKEEISFGFYGH